MDRLSECSGCPLVWVCAPPGYGKTTLLLQWFSQLQETGETVAWLKLPDRKIDGGSLLRYLAASLEEAGTGGASGRSDTGWTSVATIADRLARHSGRITFFLDDFHLDDPETGRVFVDLVENLPRECRFVIASRRTRPAPLSRLRSWGDLEEIGASDLALDDTEAQELLAHLTAGRIPPAEAERLRARLKGWVAGIQLALAGHPVTAFGDISISGARGYIREFFEEQACHDIDPHLRTFMHEISLFPTLTRELCERATERDDAGALFDELVGSGCFLTAVDTNRHKYEFHPLFRECLIDRLERTDPERVRAIARRGSSYLEEIGQIGDAIEATTLTRDWLQAAEILNRACPHLTYQGRVHQVSDLFRKLPKSVVKQFPRVLLTMAWAMSTQHDLATAHELLDLASDYLDSQGETSDAADRDRLGYLLEHGAMMIAQFADDQAEVERRCQRLLEKTAQIDSYVVGSVESSLLYAQREQFNLRDLSHLSKTARARFRDAASDFGVVWHQAIVGPTLSMAGDTAGAVRALQEGMAAAQGFASHEPWFPSVPASLLAEVHYERNELDEARRLLAEFRTRLKHGFVDQLIAAHVTWARLLATDDRFDDAMTDLADTVSFAKNRGIRRLQDVATGEWMRLLLACGRMDEALQITRTEGLDRDPQLLAPVKGVTTGVEARAMTFVRITKATGRTRDAMPLAKRWAAFTSERGAVRSAIRWDILVSQLLFMDGDVSAARRRMRKAAASATPGRFLRAFLDEGEGALQLLAAPDHDHAPATATDTFIQTVLDLSGRAAPAQQPGREEEDALAITPLTAREIEIAAWVGAGLSNREIGDRLAMTEGSVKWHLQQIYDKIGVRRRASAIQRLRELGLLP